MRSSSDLIGTSCSGAVAEAAAVSLPMSRRMSAGILPRDDGQDVRLVPVLIGMAGVMPVSMCDGFLLVGRQRVGVLAVFVIAEHDVKVVHQPCAPRSLVRLLFAARMALLTALLSF